MIENITARAVEGRLALSWAAATVFRAITVQAAADIEFTKTRRQFVLPAGTSGCSLDLGPGLWYYRIGGLHGQEEEGEVLWAGIYPPVRLLATASGTKIVLPAVEGRLMITSTQAIDGGVRLATNLKEPYLAFVDYSKDERVSASTSKTVYIRDWGRGDLTVRGLSAGTDYFFRVATFVEGLDLMPVGAVKPLAVGVMVGSRAAAGLKETTGTGRAEAAADRALLRDVSHRPVVRFSSYVDYVKFQAAQARTRERARPV